MGVLFVLSIPTLRVQYTNKAAAGAATVTYNFGTVSTTATGPIAHTFTLTNTSGNPMTVDYFRCSCSCTSATVMDANGAEEPLPATVVPGQPLPIRVSVNPKGMAPGPVDRYAWVFVRGRHDPSFTLEITGTLVGPVAAMRDAQPTLLHFGPMRVGQT